MEVCRKKILIRDGDIAFVIAGAFILGVAAAIFAWNIAAILSILFLGGLAAIYYFNSKKLWPALVVVLLVFIFGVGYCHFLTPAKVASPPT